MEASGSPCRGFTRGSIQIVLVSRLRLKRAGTKVPWTSPSAWSRKWRGPQAAGEGGHGVSFTFICACFLRPRVPSLLLGVGWGRHFDTHTHTHTVSVGWKLCKSGTGSIQITTPPNGGWEPAPSVLHFEKPQDVRFRRPSEAKTKPCLFCLADDKVQQATPSTAHENTT